MRAMLGEQNTEQFRVITTVDGKTIKDQKIHDPFANTTVVLRMRLWDAIRAVFLKSEREARVCVRIEGSQAAQRRIMMMNPYELEEENQQILAERALSRAQTATEGFCLEAQC